MDKQININMQGTEMTLRQGNAPDIIIPKGKEIGFLPHSFLELANKKTFDPENTLVFYSIRQRRIEIQAMIKSETQKGEDIYNAVFEIDKTLTAFKINEEHFWTLNDLGDHIKMNRNLVPDKPLDLVKNLKTLTANVNQKIEKTKDDRANQTDRFVQEVESNIPEFFIMESPVIEGYKKKETFKVDINFNVRGREVFVFLTSFELKETIDKVIEENINEIINHIREKQPEIIILQTS